MRSARDDNDDRFRFIEPTEVMEVTITSIWIIDVTITRGHLSIWKYSNTILTHDFHELLSTFGEFFFSHKSIFIVSVRLYL